MPRAHASISKTAIVSCRRHTVYSRTLSRPERAANAEWARHRSGAGGARAPPWLAQDERRGQGRCQCEQCTRIATKVRELSQTRETALKTLRDGLGRLAKYQKKWWEHEYERSWQQDEILDDLGA